MPKIAWIDLSQNGSRSGESAPVVWETTPGLTDYPVAVSRMEAIAEGIRGGTRTRTRVAPRASAAL